jgi:SAM-dependent methyltransferase
MTGNQPGVVYGAPDLTGSAEKNAAIVHDRMFSLVLNCKPASVLEVGSGRGALGARWSASGIRYVGLEPVGSELDYARKMHPEVRFLHGSCYDNPADLGLGRFDLVYSNDVIEHLYEPRKLAQFSKAHLNPEGMIVCGTPHYGSYLRNLLLSITNRWDKHHTPLWDGGHIKFFSKRSLERLWSEAGFGDFTWGEITSSVPLVPMYLYCTARLVP